MIFLPRSQHKAKSTSTAFSHTLFLLSFSLYSLFLGLLDWMLKTYSSGYFSVKLLQFSVRMTFPKMRLQSATKLLRHSRYSNRVTTENKRMHTPSPLPLSFIQSCGVCCFQEVARTAAKHCMKGMGE